MLNGMIIKLTIIMSIRMKTIITTMWINIIIIIKKKNKYINNINKLTKLNNCNEK